MNSRRQSRRSAVALVLFPVVATPFVVFQLGAQTLILGMIALSLMILGGYGGMVSMAQLTVAGVAGYAVAILGPNGTGVLGLNWPWEIYVPVAILVAGIVSALIGAIAVRTAGIYTIMITLAVGVAFFYFAQQNYSLFNGHSGFRGVRRRTCSASRGETQSRSTFCASPWRRSPIRRSSMPRARRSASRSWRVATIRGASARSATTSLGSGSPPSSSQD